MRDNYRISRDYFQFIKSISRVETELLLPILSQPRFDVPPYDFSPRVSAKFHHFSNNRVAANFPCYHSRNVNEGARNLYRFEARVAQRRTNRRIDSLARGPVTYLPPPLSPRLSFLPFFLTFFRPLLVKIARQKRIGSKKNFIVYLFLIFSFICSAN